MKYGILFSRLKSMNSNVRFVNYTPFPRFQLGKFTGVTLSVTPEKLYSKNVLNWA